MSTKQKELNLLQDPLLVPPEDDYEYEKFYRKHIQPIQVKKVKKKEKQIRNYCKKRNKKIPSFTINPLDDTIDVDDSDKEISFINDSDDNIPENIQFDKGKQLTTFIAIGSASSKELAFEGDYIIKQLWKVDDEWEEIEIFKVNPTERIIIAKTIPYDFQLLYGKILIRIDVQNSLNLHSSLDNINSSLQDIDLKNKEMQFIDKNLSNQSFTKVPNSKLSTKKDVSGTKRYRIKHNSRNDRS